MKDRWDDYEPTPLWKKLVLTIFGIVLGFVIALALYLN